MTCCSGMDLYWDAALACDFEGQRVACSGKLGLLAVLGTQSGQQAIVILSGSLPQRQALLRLPDVAGRSCVCAFEWSPSTTEDTLLLAWSNGDIVVASMSSMARCAAKLHACTLSATRAPCLVLCSHCKRHELLRPPATLLGHYMSSDGTFRPLGDVRSWSHM